MTSDTKNSPNSRLFGCDEAVAQTITALISCYQRQGKLLVCGNGGSAADAEHIVGEMMKGFCLPRRLSDNDKARLASVAGDDTELLATKLQYGLAALSLVSHSALITATANDQDGQLIFAQQVWGIGRLAMFCWQFRHPAIHKMCCWRRKWRGQKISLWLG
jgi:D-sedoheptulose 7-phosphate isomerase